MVGFEFPYFRYLFARVLLLARGVKDARVLPMKYAILSRDVPREADLSRVSRPSRND